MTIRQGQALDGVEMLNRQQTADYFGIHVKTLDRWAESGIIKPTILGRLIFYTVESIREATARGTAA
jgi:predicted site-specific integrase-resolvase